jgi:hypothetical protein
MTVPSVLAAEERVLNALPDRTGRTSMILSTVLKGINGAGEFLGR